MISSAVLKWVLMFTLFGRVFATFGLSRTLKNPVRRIKEVDQRKYDGTTRCMRIHTCNCTERDIMWYKECFDLLLPDTIDWYLHSMNERQVCKEHNIYSWEKGTFEEWILRACHNPDEDSYNCMNTLNNEFYKHMIDLSVSNEEREALQLAFMCVMPGFNKCIEATDSCLFDKDE